MAKRKKHDDEAEAEAPAAGGTVTTFPSNGSPATSVEYPPPAVSVGEAMRQAAANLGEVTIDEALAVGHLRRLAELDEEIAKASAAYEVRKDAAKVAKDRLTLVTDTLLAAVREVTRQTPLPLFDAQQAADDRQRMIDEAGAPVEGAPA